MHWPSVGSGSKLFDFSTLLLTISDNLQGTPAMLSLCVLTPCLRAEQLLVTVDTHTGMIQCHIPQYSRYPPFISDLQHAFNADRSNLPVLISDIR